MKTIRAGVVGPGSIGINHARIYSELEGCELTAIYDANRANAEKAAAKYGGKVCATLEEFASLVDVASVATNTESHHEIGTFLLKQGKHLLVEKPIATNTAQALDLAATAAANNCILQVGHIERFNPGLEALEQQLHNPRFLEVTRLSPERTHQRRAVRVAAGLAGDDGQMARSAHRLRRESAPSACAGPLPRSAW